MLGAVAREDTYSHHLSFIRYVDAQLRTSRRFDAARIEREHPQLFVPLPHRRSSSSVSSVTSSYNGNDLNNSQQEGQLRYWTAEMCSRDPDLFDFVITVRPVLQFDINVTC